MRTLDRREFLTAAAAAWAAASAPPLLFPRSARAAADDELAWLDATELSGRVRRGEVSPLELAEAAIARIERLDPQLHAVVAPLFERGRAAAKQGPPEATPFAGIPYLIKDLHALEGAPVTFGSAFFRLYVAPRTDAVIRRQVEAGLVPLGMSKSPEFGLLPITEPLVHGPTRNPWDTERTPGGSSGGAAAAVASGMVPFAQASDGGGSIRIPASCCGLFGLKPSRGRNPQEPHADVQGLTVVHCVSRSVRDSAILLDATRGALPGDRWSAPAPRRPYREELEAEPRRLRIAFTTTDFQGRKAHADCVAAVEATAKLCAELGHEVREARPDIDGAAFEDAFLLLWASYAGRAVRGAARALGKEPPREAFEPWTWQLAAADAAHSPADVELAWRVLGGAGYAMAHFLGDTDLLLTPTLGEPPLAIGAIDQNGPYEETRALLSRFVPYTPIANVTGQPAMSVPLHWNEAGLPIGSHFVARRNDEATLFRLAAQLERARPWAGRHPGVAA